MNGSVSGSNMVRSLVVVMVMVGGQDGAAAAVGKLDDRAAVGRFEHRDVERLGRSADGDLAAVDTEHGVPAPGLLEVVGRHRDRVAFAGELGDQRFQALGGGPVET